MVDDAVIDNTFFRTAVITAIMRVITALKIDAEIQNGSLEPKVRV